MVLPVDPQAATVGSPLSAAGPDEFTAHGAADGAPIPGVFGVGLGSGFVPRGAMAREASFAGQQNSLWLYQNGLGGMIYRGTRNCAAAVCFGNRRARLTPRRCNSDDNAR
jgi:hypothetical protein